MVKSAFQRTFAAPEWAKLNEQLGRWIRNLERLQGALAATKVAASAGRAGGAREPREHGRNTKELYMADFGIWGRCGIGILEGHALRGARVPVAGSVWDWT